MSITAYLERQSWKIWAVIQANKVGCITTILTIICILLLLTPFCGWLFSCGCTWPGLGLADHCNYVIQQTGPKCPWCVSSLSAVAIIGFATLIAAWVSFQLPTTRFLQTGGCSVAMTVMISVSIFLMVALFLSYPLAKLQPYSEFIMFKITMK